MTRPSSLLAVTLVGLCSAHVWVHAQAPAQPQPAPAAVTALSPDALYKEDVHASAKLACTSCHTDPGPPAMIERTKIAPLCSRCHSDATYMQGFVEKPRTNQLLLYATTTHGKQMAKGETRVATCTDCHRAHGILPASDPKSSVAVRNVAMTCARCHSDKARMEPFEHFGDPPGDWKKSVHAAALEHDSSAPTCSTCHSAHSTMLAGAKSLQMVCAECHAREADLYLKSTHKKAFDGMDQPGCLTCHSNHEIVKPTDAFVGLDDPAICGSCHDTKMAGGPAIKELRQKLDALSEAVTRARTVLDRAVVAGMLVDEAQLDLREAVQQQILTRVAIHTVQVAAVSAPADKGLAAAARAEQSGLDALAELQVRRRGLAVATVLILGFLVTLGIKIRRLPPHQ